MSTTNFTVNDPLSLKLWARKAFTDSVKETLYGKLIGKSDRSVIQVKDELQKGEGDRTRFSLRSLPKGIGVQDDETLEGKEEGLEFQNFDLQIGEKRHAFKVDLNISQQRSLFDVRGEAKAALQEWAANYIDTTMFEYLTGLGQGPGGVSQFHPTSPLGGNPIDSFSTDRIVYGGDATAQNNIDAADVMSLTVVDKLVERAKLASPTMRKANFDGRNVWVLILHPFQVSSIRANTSTGQWLDIQKAVTQGGGKSLLFEEALGVYRDVLLVESTRIPVFNAGAGGNVPCARAVFLGAQAGVVAYGRQNQGDGRLAISERSTDYGKRLGQSVTLLWGIRRTKFSNQSDFASFSINTAAAPL